MLSRDELIECRGAAKILDGPAGKGICELIESHLDALDALDKLMILHQEWEDAANHAWDNPCADEQHCTCVPLLAAKLDTLKAENERLKDANTRITEAIVTAQEIPTDHIGDATEKVCPRCGGRGQLDIFQNGPPVRCPDCGGRP